MARRSRGEAPGAPDRIQLGEAKKALEELKASDEVVEKLASQLLGGEALEEARRVGFFREPARLVLEAGDAAEAARRLSRLALPTARTVNVFVVIEATDPLVIRHEGGADVSELEVRVGNKLVRVPAILNTKMQAVARRAMLHKVVRGAYDAACRASSGWVGSLASLIAALNLRHPRPSSEVANAVRGCSWACFVAPQGREKSGGKLEERIAPESYCGYCPSCLIYGYAGVEAAGGYNVKSRVEGDAYYATCETPRCTETRTFNAVDDATKTTYYGGGETGALYQLTVVSSGTVFIGKIAVKDASLAELLLILYSLSKVERVGARVTHFGGIKVRVPALLLSWGELGSSYEATSMVLAKTLEEGRRPLLPDVIDTVTDYAEALAKQYGGSIVAVVTGDDLLDSIRGIRGSEMESLVAAAWRDSLLHKAGIEAYLS